MKLNLNKIRQIENGNRKSYETNAVCSGDCDGITNWLSSELEISNFKLDITFVEISKHNLRNKN